jgi:hypothetical protein
MRGNLFTALLSTVLTLEFLLLREVVNGRVSH